MHHFMIIKKFMVIEVLNYKIEAYISMVLYYHQASKKIINLDYLWYIHKNYGNEQ
jgi:hypothetical protein